MMPDFVNVLKELLKVESGLTIYNAGLNDSGQYSCDLNTSHASD